MSCSAPFTQAEQQPSAGLPPRGAGSGPASAKLWPFTVELSAAAPGGAGPLTFTQPASSLPRPPPLVSASTLQAVGLDPAAVHASAAADASQLPARLPPRVPSSTQLASKPGSPLTGPPRMPSAASGSGSDSQLGAAQSAGLRKAASQGSLSKAPSSGSLPKVASQSSLEDSGSEREEGAAKRRRSKKPRLVWTGELHQRFINAVNHLGVKAAVPKTILQLMNVEGMTRENVASHLQKYRQQLKRSEDLGAAHQEPSVPAAQLTSSQGPSSLATSLASLQSLSALGFAPPGMDLWSSPAAGTLPLVQPGLPAASLPPGAPQGIWPGAGLPLTSSTVPPLAIGTLSRPPSAASKRAAPS